MKILGLLKNHYNLKIQTGFFHLLDLFNFSKVSKRIKAHEGFRNSIYKDMLGNNTIGYGHLVKSSDSFSFNQNYSKKVLTKIFYNDLNKAINDFKKNYNLKTLPSNVQEVLIEMIFQLGIKKTLNFKKFNLNLKKNYYYLAAFEMIKSRWYQQTPKRVEKLINLLISS